MIKTRLTGLRKQMKQQEIAWYYIPSSDYHQSEYISPYFKTREYMSGFDGSAGALLVGEEIAMLWTDGRYFIQAESQLKDTGIVLMKQGEPNTPTVQAFIQDHIQAGSVFGVDGKVVSCLFGTEMESILTDKQALMESNLDLVGQIWNDRPALPSGPAFLLDLCYAGKSVSEKLYEVRKAMVAKQATHHLLASLDDIGWLLNVRGSDVNHTPLVLSYVLLTQEKAFFYMDQNKISNEIQTQWNVDGIEIRPYDQVYQDLAMLTEEDRVLVDKNRINHALAKAIKTTMIASDNPTALMKAIKNPVELQNLRQSHIKDGVAVTKFMIWLKNNVGKIDMSELSVTTHLQQLRQAQDGYLDDSFSTICGYQANGAMMHYKAVKDSDAKIQAEGMLLVDSGGHYYEGTTDITRTIVLGPLPEEQRSHFTAVVRGMLNLSRAKFLYGCTGINLDVLARGPVWDLDLDYRCGTGHGVGYLMSVHEGPQGFRWKPMPGRSEGAVLEPGMVITNEPGVYVEGSHGIRIENELVVRVHATNDYGQFLDFETITVAPIDLDGIDVSSMTSHERAFLNGYHAMVYQTIAPYLNEEEQSQLAIYTKVI